MTELDNAIKRGEAALARCWAILGDINNERRQAGDLPLPDLQPGSQPVRRQASQG